MPVRTLPVRLRQGGVEGVERLPGVGPDAQAGAVGFQHAGFGVDLDDPAARLESEVVGGDFAQ
ncbi:hypothetical protein D3C84_1218820 [compost metagenome]